jgi:hypothetical protein
MFVTEVSHTVASSESLALEKLFTSSRGGGTVAFAPAFHFSLPITLSFSLAPFIRILPPKVKYTRKHPYQHHNE